MNVEKSLLDLKFGGPEQGWYPWVREEVVMRTKIADISECLPLGSASLYVALLA